MCRAMPAPIPQTIRSDTALRESRSQITPGKYNPTSRHPIPAAGFDFGSWSLLLIGAGMDFYR